MRSKSEAWLMVRQNPDSDQHEDETVLVTISYPLGLPVIETDEGLRLTAVSPVPDVVVADQEAA
jgi:hypothetical protein